MKALARTAYFPLLFLILFSASCSEYQQVVKSTDPQYKSTKAKEYYDKEQYYRAQPLFEELMGFYKGTNLIQDVLYYYAYCHYHTNQYLLASYHFKNYASTYIQDPRAEECLFMHAKCFQEISPNYMLEQSYTTDCINAAQLFVNSYPNSKYVQEANQMVDEMRAKLEKKAFYSANLYYKMERYKAASVAFRNLLRDYPDSKNAEQAMFLMLKADYLYALNSVSAKQQERFEETIATYQNYVSKYSGGEYGNQAKDIYEASIKNLNKLKPDE
jgi:outer membrane protein assembly factor BamD